MTLLVFMALLEFLEAGPMAPQDAVQRVFEVEGYPAELKAAAELTVKRCSSCHSIEKVTGSSYKGSAWRRVVERMQSKPRARITRREAEDITKFLAHHTSARIRPLKAAPPRGLQARTAVFPRRRFARLSSAAVADMLAPPIEVDLAGRSCKVGKIERVAVGKPDEAARFSGVIEGEAFSVSLARGADGFTTATSHELRSWAVGPHRFRLILVLWAPPTEDALSELALVVERVVQAD